MLGHRPRPDAAEAVRAALAEVCDPELHRPLPDVGMLADVRVERGRVVVDVALTTPSCPYRERLERDVVDVASRVPGVRDVTVSFTAMPEVDRLHLARQLRAAQPSGRAVAPRVYAVASGKGGVGKSTVTANLAVALAAAGQRVGLVDADVWGYSQPQLFGVRRSPVALSGMMLPVQAHGVRLVSVGFFVDDDEPVVWRGPMLHKAVQQFLDDVYWGELDVLLLDLPPGTGDVTLSLLELLDQLALLVVTTPQRAAHTVAARVGRMAQDARVPVAGVVENMSAAVCAQCGERSSVFGAGGGQVLADRLAVPLLGQVPLDRAALEAGEVGVPVVAHEPGAPSAAELRRVAESLPAVRRSLVGVPLPLSVR